MKSSNFFIPAVFCSLFSCASVNAAVSLDRTRVIFDGGKNSMSVTLHNYHKSLPFLAQSWIEDENGKKITSPLVVLPPIQRIEASKDSLLKIQSLPGILKLPQDRETLYWFNVREIPPRSDTPNVLQLASQTKVKMFYRPEALKIDALGKHSQFQRKLELTKLVDKKLFFKNTQPYYITVVGIANDKAASSVDGFKVFMLAPFEEKTLDLTTRGDKIAVTYIDDYGAQRKLTYACNNGKQCVLQKGK